MKRALIILAIISIIVLGCKENVAPIENKTNASSEVPGKAECQTSTDCTTGGCSGQVCVAKDKSSKIITTCEYRSEYECLKETQCTCVEGKCSWQDNDAYTSCLNEKKNTEDMVIA
jgi:eight-cysteine-cluster-containing protein